MTADAAMYNLLLRAAARRGDSCQRLHRKVQDMAAHGTQPDAHTYVILLQACASQGDAGLAQAAWDGLLQSGGRKQMPVTSHACPVALASCGVLSAQLGLMMALTAHAQAYSHAMT